MDNKKDPVLELCLDCFKKTGQNICPKGYSDEYLVSLLESRQKGFKILDGGKLNPKKGGDFMQIQERQEEKKDCGCGQECPGQNGGECACKNKDKEKPSEDEDEREYKGCA